MSELGVFKFEVSGFGEAHWRVDVEMHLLTIMEQLPDTLSWLRSDRVDAFDLMFCEQGVERTLRMQREREDIVITAVPFSSGMRWQPSVPIERMAMSELEAMLLNLLVRFLDIGGRIFPGIWSHSFVTEWLTVDHLSDMTSPPPE